MSAVSRARESLQQAALALDGIEELRVNKTRLVDIDTNGLEPLAAVAARGIQVQCFQVFEQFAKDRGLEWSAALTAARVPPSRLQPQSITYARRVISGMSREVTNEEDVTVRLQALTEGSESIISLAAREMTFSRFFTHWPGSNLSIQDVLETMSILGDGDGRPLITRCWQGLFTNPPKQGIDGAFKAIADPRHEAAHRPDLSTPWINLKTLPLSARNLCIAFDTAGTTLVKNLIAPSSRKSLGPPPTRRMERRKSQFADVPPRKKTRKLYNDREECWEDAKGFAKRNGELLLSFDENNSIDDWYIEP